MSVRMVEVLRRIRRGLRNQRGQAMVEYSVVLYGLFGISLVAGWPFMIRILRWLSDAMQGTFWYYSLPLG
jgi:hypothetical protein